jgi:hypothetical protein
MNISFLLNRFIRKLLGLEEISEKLLALQESNQNILSKISAVEQRMVESTRAIMTLSLIQANLIREMSNFASDLPEKEIKKSKSNLRKSGTDFTN